jgi:hypothetical protein
MQTFIKSTPSSGLLRLMSPLFTQPVCWTLKSSCSCAAGQPGRLPPLHPAHGIECLLLCCVHTKRLVTVGLCNEEQLWLILLVPSYQNIGKLRSGHVAPAALAKLLLYILILDK